MGRPYDTLPTSKQKEVLMFLVEYVETHGYQPSIKEMADHFQVNPTAISDRLNQLQSKGFVTLSQNGAERSIQFNDIAFTAHLKTKEGSSD